MTSGIRYQHQQSNMKRRRQQSPSEKLSRLLSKALRHHAPNLGLSMTPDGYVPVSQILSSEHTMLKGAWTVQDIETAVATSDKQRFQLDQRPTANYPNISLESAAENDSNTVLCIRATQGHSLGFIDPNALLTAIPKVVLAKIPVIVHGTYQKPWETSICRDGLNRMNRNHIHFASGLPHGQNGVISGMRKSCSVYIYVDAAKCSNHPDIAFYQSANGVILTAGVKDSGTLPVEFFSHVTSSDGKILLDQRKPRHP